MGWFDGDGARTRLWVRDGSRTILRFVEAAKRRRRLILLWSVLIVIALAVGGLGLSRYMKTQASLRMVNSWSSLSQCLLGTPLAVGERAGMRFRKRQLTSLTQSDRIRANAKVEPWPDRCTKYAHMLVESVKREPQHQSLSKAVGQLATALKGKTAYFQDLSEEIEAVWVQAAKAAIARVPQANVPKPPDLVDPLTIDAFGTVRPITRKPVDLSRVKFERHRDSVVRFIVEDKSVQGSPLLCSVSDDRGVCRSLPRRMHESGAAGFRILGTADEGADPLVMAAKGVNTGVFRSDTGRKLAKLPVLGGYVSKEGRASLLTLNAANKLSMLEALADRTKQKPLALPGWKVADAKRDSGVFWQSLALVAASLTGENWLLGAAVKSRGPGVGPLIKIGQVPAARKGGKELPQARLTACRSGYSTVVRVNNGREAYLSFAISGRWTKMVKLPAASGVLGCGEASATVVRVRSTAEGLSMNTRLDVQACTPASCEGHSLSMGQLLVGEVNLMPDVLLSAVPVGEKLLVLWGAGQRAGLRMRLAPVSTIANSADTILFDDLVKGGHVVSSSTVLDWRLLPAGRFAVLVLNTVSGLHAIRLDIDGGQSAVSFER